MVDPRISDWVRKSHNSGFSRDAIAEKLLEKGYHLNDVEGILNECFGNTGSGNKRASKLIITLVISMVLVVSVTAGFFFWKNSTPSPDKIRNVINERIIPGVVLIECLDESGQIIGSGSGFYSGGDDYRVETNAHVVIADDGNFHGCWVYFPTEDGSFYDSTYWASTAYTFNDMESFINGEKVNGMDYAQLLLTEPGTDDEGLLFPFPPQKESIFRPIEKLCRERDIELADKIFVIGYPGIGSDSITISEGIISGFLGNFGEWIKVSANVNPGNSGGVAIGMDDGCMYGIPTQLQYDETGSIGQLMSYSFVSLFLDGATGNKTRYDFSLDESEFLVYENAEVGVRIRYPPELTMGVPYYGEVATFILPKKNSIEEYDTIIRLYYTPAVESTDLEIYAEEAIETVKNSVTDMALVSRENIFLGETEAARIAYTFTSGNKKYKTIGIFSLHHGAEYILALTVEEADFDDASRIFDKIVEGFEFTSTDLNQASGIYADNLYGFSMLPPSGWYNNKYTQYIIQFDSPIVSGSSASIIVGVFDMNLSSFDSEENIEMFADTLKQGVTDFVLLEKKPLTINGKKAYSFTFVNTIPTGESKEAQQVYIERNDNQAFLVAYVSDAGQFEAYYDVFTDTLSSFSSS